MMDKTIKVESIAYGKSKKRYPFIRLKGQWLEEAGIRYGEHIHITIEDNHLKIAPKK